MKTNKNLSWFLLLKPFVIALIAFEFLSCNQEELILGNENVQKDETIISAGLKKSKIDICHYDEDYGGWVVLSVSESSWGDHIHHGDVRLDDSDGDGFVPDNECGFGQMGDCDDSDANNNPDTIWYLDSDGDNYAISTLTQCTNPGAGYTMTAMPVTDCDDTNAGINPSATEVCGNGIDDDCDGDTDEDCCPVDPLIVTLADGSYLYVQPCDNSTGVAWGGWGLDIGASSFSDGATNTAIIVEKLGHDSNYAAKVCADLVYGGFDDWYLPAMDELRAIYQQLGPSPNNGFATRTYWSSTEDGILNAYAQYFSYYGSETPNDKRNGPYGTPETGGYVHCRCVRK